MEATRLGLLDPLFAVGVCFAFLCVMIYRRVNLGLTLTSTASVLALLALDMHTTGMVLWNTASNLSTISVLAATFGIMLMSQLYKETGIIKSMSSSLSRALRNSKLMVSLLPAIIGLLPVAGGALMSAPLVEAESEKLSLKAEKKTFVNIWFRHVIFPIYPVSQVLILAASLSGSPITSVILRQIPVVIIMVLAGYLLGLREASTAVESKWIEGPSARSELKRFIVTLLPVLVTIVSTVGLGIDVSVSVFLGIGILLAIAKPSLQTLLKPFRNWAIYGITLAAFGAFFLRNVVSATGVSQTFGSYVAGGGVHDLLLLTFLPAVLAFFVGSPLAGLAISFSVLEGVLSINARTVALLYISSFLGYIVAPTHLCLVLTADYFKCPLGKVYRYLLPSLFMAFASAVSLYILV